MKQINYPIRPEAGKVYRAEKTKTMQAEAEQIERLGFSEMLTALLVMTLSDGMVQKTLFSLLKDILPYTEPQDRQKITKMLGMSEMLRCSTAKESRISHHCLTSTERLLGLLNVLKKYSAKGTSDQFTMMERFMRMQQKLDRSGGDMMPLAMELMGADMGNVMQMMNLFGGKF